MYWLFVWDSNSSNDTPLLQNSSSIVSWKNIALWLSSSTDVSNIEFGAGITIGPSIGKAICKALGIEKGLLYDLFTSRIFTTAVASYIGYKN